MSVNIAIDGPAGAGKSTIAKLIAKKLSYIYVDTGAMYRAMALHLLKNGVSMDDAAAIEAVCGNADISISYEDGRQQVFLNGENVTPMLRTEEVGNMASKSSSNGAVREKLVRLQQKLASEENVVMDGRDIGTVVLPDAAVKIYLTASSLTRARRRHRELAERGEYRDLEAIRADIEERDYRDMHRRISPLKQAADAVLVDSSDMTVDEVTERILSVCRDRKVLD